MEEFKLVDSDLVIKYICKVLTIKKVSVLNSHNFSESHPIRPLANEELS